MLTQDAKCPQQGLTYVSINVTLNANIQTAAVQHIRSCKKIKNTNGQPFVEPNPHRPNETFVRFPQMERMGVEPADVSMLSSLLELVKEARELAEHNA